MTFIDVITAMVILGLFISGFSQAFLPVYSAWNAATKEYRTAQTIYFIKESFEKECARPDRNMEIWKKAIKAAKEMDSYEITEITKEDVVLALKLTCVISGEHFEILGACTP